ncbi:MAG: PAS domain S-box protein [Bacteroidetes bacterium]|nr:PAS domain S-box protein [Bacteroidota bacterium]
MEEKTIKIIEQVPVGIITFSAGGEIDYVNQNFRKFGILYHFETSNLPGNNILQKDLFPNISIKDELHQLLKGLPFEKEIKQITTNDGSQIDLIVKGSPIFEQDKIIGGILLIEDIKILMKTKEELELRTEYFEKAIHYVNDVMIVTNPKGIVQFASGTALKKINIADKKIVGGSILDLFDREVKSLISDKIEKVNLNIEASRFDFNIEQAKEHYSFECKLEPILNKRGTLQFLFFFFNNITVDVSEKKRLAKKVDELSYYKSITNNLKNALFVLDKEGKIIYWDEQSELLFGLSGKDVLGKFFGSTLELFDKRFFENIKKDLEKEKIWKVNLNIFGKEHKKEIFEAKFSYLDDYQNTIVVLCSNITRKVKEEEKLKLAEESYKNLLENTSELICKVDSKGNIIFTNKTFLEVLGYNKDEIKQKQFNHLIQPKYFENNIFNVNTFGKTMPTIIELPLLTNEGSSFLAKVTFIPKREGGTSLHYLCYITEIPAAEEVDEIELLYPALFKASQDGIAVEEDGRIVVANDSFAQIFGYDSGEKLAGKDLLDLVSNDDILKVAEYFRLKEHGKSAPDRFEFLGKKSDNTFFYTELSISSFESNDKKYIVMVTRDITERKRAQKVIRESEEKYRNITENIDDFLYTFERVGNYMRPLFYTVAVEKITGYDQADFLGDSKLFLKIIHPDDFADVKKRLSTLMKSNIQNSGEMDFRIINKQGNIVWVRNKVNFIKNSSGEIQKVYGLVSDITLKKRAEEEMKKSTEDLIKLNETKDRFLSIISHDLRTPFSSILGFTDLLANDEELTNEERKQYVKYIQESSKSMLSLVNSLLDWTRLQTGRIKFEPERIDPSSLIEKSIHSVSGDALRKRIEIYSTVSKGKFIFVDKSLINQVFNNLLSNAIKFTNSDGRITISVKPASTLSFLEFSVRDTGQGIKEENLDKLFSVDTKFTTEGTAGEKGSGLGLSLVKEIVEKHGGIIWVESEYGNGSNFKFTLPVASANILIVDDNRTDGLLYSKILKNITPDYTVDLASNGVEALEKIKRSTPALVITDHSMPEMDGYNLVKQLKKEGLLGKPQVIVLSTEMDRNIIEDYNELGVEYVFQKPVNLRSFKQAVEKSLRKYITGNR